ncbi:MAG: AAA family ATPase, partial [Chloroflexota bacterium]
MSDTITTTTDLHALPDPGDPRATAEAVMFEIRRVIVGQDAMLERVLVGLLSGGHLLLEGVPGLAKTLTIKTLADVLGGTFKRIQFTPDLMPSDLVGTRIYRPDQGSFDVEQGPVFANFLLADEINRAPAKVQSALLEVMQEHQVTIGGETHRVPEPFLVLATQNPIESEGTYDLPEAQVDRFLFKLVLDYPAVEDEIAVVDRISANPPVARRSLAIRDLLEHQRVAREVFADRSVLAYAVSLVDATRHPARHGLADLEPLIQFGAGPRASLGLVQAARALALLRNRTHVAPHDVRDLAPDVLRHRLVLSYDALSAGVSADDLLDRVLAEVTEPEADHVKRS